MFKKYKKRLPRCKYCGQLLFSSIFIVCGICYLKYINRVISQPEISQLAIAALDEDVPGQVEMVFKAAVGSFQK